MANREPRKSAGLPLEVPSEAKGIKYDDGKTRLDLVPSELEDAVAKVLMFGAGKYGENNWQKLEDFERRYFAAALRHLHAYRKGERLDAESGLPHLSHAACCIAFLLWKSEDQKRYVYLADAKIEVQG